MPLKIDTVEEPQINLTSMIDIVFLLIIFFMVGTRFTELERQYDIQLPTVSDAQPLTSLPDEMIINVRASGEIVVNGETRSLAELEEDLRRAKTNYAEQAVVIRGDGDGPYQNVVDILAACERSKIRSVSLPVRMKSGERR